MGNASLDGNFPFIPFIPSVPNEKIGGWALWIDVDSASLNSLSSLNSLAQRLLSTLQHKKNRTTLGLSYFHICHQTIGRR